MRSTIKGCRNHLLFFIGKGAKAIVCNRIVTIRVFWTRFYGMVVIIKAKGTQLKK